MQRVYIAHSSPSAIADNAVHLEATFGVFNDTGQGCRRKAGAAKAKLAEARGGKAAKR